MLEAFRKLLRALGIGGAAERGGAGASAPDSNGGDGSESGASRSVETLGCQEVLERLFEYLDGELESPAEIQVEAHLEKCRRCYPRLQFEKAFMEALERVRAGEEPSPELRRRILDLLCEEGLDLG